MATTKLPTGTTKAYPTVKAAKAFRDMTGHFPAECLAGCYRPKGKGDKRVEVHRASHLRPSPNTGRPFAETWEERKARKAAKAASLVNGPVRIIRAAPESPTVPVVTTPVPVETPATPVAVGKIMDTWKEA